jgi:predicted glutamine amidotransferase
VCRLLGYVSQSPATFGDVLGPDLAAFRELSRVHKDGWGVARREAEGRLAVAKSAEPAFADPDFEPATAAPAAAAILHLRWATGSIPVTRANAHPFVYGDLAFCHNGSVDREALWSLVAGPYREGLEGETDSEVYFRALLTALAETGDVAAAATLLLERIRQQAIAHTGLNFLLLAPDALYALCAFHPEAPILAEDPDYYELHWQESPDRVVVASSGWAADNWPRLGNGDLLTIDATSRRTGVTRVTADARA